jgi:hypothetical protein
MRTDGSVPATHHGSFVDGKGKRWEVDACDEHGDEPTDAQ